MPANPLLLERLFEWRKATHTKRAHRSKHWVTLQRHRFFCLFFLWPKSPNTSKNLSRLHKICGNRFSRIPPQRLWNPLTAEFTKTVLQSIKSDTSAGVISYWRQKITALSFAQSLSFFVMYPSSVSHLSEGIGAHAPRPPAGLPKLDSNPPSSDITQSQHQTRVWKMNLHLSVSQSSSTAGFLFKSCYFLWSWLHLHH